MPPVELFLNSVAFNGQSSNGNCGVLQVGVSYVSLEMLRTQLRSSPTKERTLARQRQVTSK